MQAFINYPTTEKGQKTLSDNLATFKAKLLLKSIEKLNTDDKTKEEVLEKVFEILNNRAKDNVI